MISIPTAASAALQDRVEKIFDHLYANSSVRTPAGIATEVGKILHVAMFLERERSRAVAFEVPKQLQREILSGGSPFVTEIAGEVRRTMKAMNKAWKLYSDDEELRLSDADIAYTCVQLDGIAISRRDRDVFGDSLEIFRSNFTKRAGGQFFTDPQVTHLAIELLQYNPLAGERLIDPAAGTGGFLLAAVNKLRSQLEERSAKDAEKNLARLAPGVVFGAEVDSEVCSAANATLIARVGDRRHSYVELRDSIRSFADGGSDPLFREGTFDCIATNPPFGTKITIKDSRVLSRFALAQSPSSELSLGFVEKTSPRAPDILFLELCVRLLKPGTGRLAIVLPYQLVSGPQATAVRQWLLSQTQIVAVVDLPPDTFQPHTGTRTSLVVVRRRHEGQQGETSLPSSTIMMATPQAIGHDRRGNPVFKRDEAGRQTDEIFSDLPAVLADFQTISRETAADTSKHSFTIQEDAVRNDSHFRLNALFHRPIKEVTSRTATRQSKDLRFVKLRSLVRRIFFPTRFKRDYAVDSAESIPFLGGSNITEWIHTSAKGIRSTDPRLSELRVEEGWILVTRSGTTGIISSVPAAWHGFAMSEHVIRIVPDPDKISPHFIEAFLRSDYGQKLLARGVFGSVIPEITPEYIGNLEVPIPTSKKVLATIVEPFASAQLARQQSIDALLRGMDAFEVWHKAN